jgi:UDP-3-O-[3-hydroxymyristoyl] glucosamine N-acyltransferase
LEDTVISEGTKMDQFVHISHNVKIGKYFLITNSLCTLVDRGAELGDYATIWAGAVILDHVRIGHHTVIGAGAVVTADVKPYETYGRSSKKSTRVC